MAKLEREIGRSCVSGVFLDELDPNRGRADKEIMPECGIMCQISDEPLASVFEEKTQEMTMPSNQHGLCGK